MHKLGKKIMDRVEAKLNQGFDGITDEELIRIKEWTCIADAITSFDYHYKIIEEMEKPENKYGETYDEHGKFYTQPKDSMGKNMKGYEHDPDMMMHRDMDMDLRRMYYTDANHMGNMNSGSSMSKYDRARRGFEEAKAVAPATDNTTATTKFFDALETELEEIKPKMTVNERSIGRTKLTNMANMM